MGLGEVKDSRLCLVLRETEYVAQEIMMTGTFAFGSSIALQGVPDSLQSAVDELVAAAPLIVGALVILLLGWIVGRVLGSVAKRLVKRVRPSQYTAGTALEPDGDPDDDLAQSLGDLVKYIVYILTILVVLDYLDIAIPGAFLAGIADGAVRLVVAVAILIAGIAIGRVVGDIVTSVVGGFELDRHTRGTPLAEPTDSVGGIGRAAGKLAEYFVYFLALLIALDYAGIGLPGAFLTGVAGGVVQIVVAAIVLVAGIVIGRFVGDFVTTLLGGFGLDGYVRSTPFANATDAVGGAANVVGRTVEYLIYFLALVAAVDVLGFPALSEPLSAFIGQIPLLIGGVLVLLVGLYLADLLGDIVASYDTSRATDIVGSGVQIFVSYVVIVFALDTAGFDTTVLTNLFNTVIVAFFGALGLGIAIAIGVGVGWGSKGYVAENIDDWMSSARRSTSDLSESGSGGTDPTTGTDSERFDDDSPGREY